MLIKQVMGVLILSIIIITLLLILKLDVENKEYMVNISSIDRKVKWARDKSCKYKMIKVYQDTLDEYNIKETNDDDWVIYFPCSYNNSSGQIKKIKPSLKDQRIFIVNNTDQISSKSNLWMNLVSKYGVEGAKKISPNSYVLYDKEDIRRFENEYDPTKIYIMKKNIQRQEGIKITSNKDTIINGNKDNYVVVQELLQDPYLIRDRKTNMRFYVLLVCQNDELSVYVHEEGFIYYTKMPFKPNTSEWGNNITTGYIERWIYHVNPLTHNDFREYLNDPDRDYSDQEKNIVNQLNNKKLSEYVFDRIYELISKVIKALDHKLCVGSQLKKHITFQLFGFDIALDDKLDPKIIEVNVGPNLKFHDKRDSEIKHMVIRDIFKVIKIVPNDDNKFIKIL